MLPRGARVCTHVHVCASVLSGLSIYQGFSLTHYVLHLYTCQIMFIFVMWDYISFYIFTSDVVHLESSDGRELMRFNLSCEGGM